MLELRSVKVMVASPIGTATIVMYADNEDSRLSVAMISDLVCQRPLSGSR
jgi:hypothetical protein